ncbi:transketolase, partial [bacterium]
EGRDVTILVYGYLFKHALEARDLLESRGYSAGLINIRTPKPIDENAILKAANNSKLLVTIEDHFLTGGLYSIVAEIFLKNQIMTKVLPFALENRWFKPALLNDLLNYEGFTGKQIADKIDNNLRANK